MPSTTSSSDRLLVALSVLLVGGLLLAGWVLPDRERAQRRAAVQQPEPPAPAPEFGRR